MDSGSTSGPNFNYILNMPLWCLTKEKVEELLKQRDQKVTVTAFLLFGRGRSENNKDCSGRLCVQVAELNDLQRKAPEDLWKEDLAVFIEELDVS